MALNTVELHGRLTHDLEVKSVKNGELKMVKFVLAVQRSDGKSADFISCTIFGQVGERFAKYNAKGSEVIVKGSLQTNNYKDKDGKNIKSTDVIVSAFDFCGNKTSNTNAPQTQVVNQGTPFEMEVDPNAQPVTAFPDFASVNPFG